MPTIVLKEFESFESALRRFKKIIDKTGLMNELREREAYEKPTTERKRKHQAAIKRHLKQKRAHQLPPKLYWFTFSSKNVIMFLWC